MEDYFKSEDKEDANYLFPYHFHVSTDVNPTDRFVQSMGVGDQLGPMFIQDLLVLFCQIPQLI